jgi:rSAM/selenodomain-associated transferase 2
MSARPTRPILDLPASPRAAAGTVSIIIPCWRDDAVLEPLAARWLGHDAVCEIIVAAASGAGASAKEGLPGVRTIRCTRPGRGNQMNEAARLAAGDILLFHHADTELTDAHFQSLRTAMANDPALGGGAFRRRFDERHPRLRWIEPWEARRCRSFGPLFGDQSIFVRRGVFEALGGFADIPLMEDVEFSCRLRRHARVALLEPAICSSARKHLQQGRWRTTLANALFLALYAFGMSPARLHGWYYRRALADAMSPGAERQSS